MTEKQRTHFQQLRDREAAGAVLTPEEQGELSAFLRQIEAEEAAYLRPATARLRAESAVLEERNRALETLLHRKEALVARLETVVVELEAERQAINEELARITGGAPKAGANA